MSDDSAERHARLLRDCKVGTVVAGRELELSLARVLAFSGGPLDEPGWPQRNLHTDLAKAKEAGLPHIIASGTQSEGLLLGLLVETFGTLWHECGRIELRFRKPVPVGERVRPMLEWTEVDVGPAHTRFTAACWCADASGERVVDGTASCMVPRAAGVHA
jgi:hypothetical protein